MSKKNTLIYLDEDLVRMAKQKKINISELTEKTLRQQLLPILSSGEKMLFDMDSYLEELKSMNRCFFLPFSVKRLELENIGPIESISIDFSPGINIIRGSNGSGKTTILKSIAMAFGLFIPERETMLKMMKKEGFIKISTSEHENLIRLDKDNINGRKDAGCLLLDDAIAMLPPDKAKIFIRKLKKKYHKQLIMTISRDDFDVSGSNVIILKDKYHLS
ncbi:MAG: AAA family ATPase [Candidatus Omnitrophica bacterium]|nr:AAA family ATPase [Candidatus Omnitrophota bacterium]